MHIRVPSNRQFSIEIRFLTMVLTASAGGRCASSSHNYYAQPAGPGARPTRIQDARGSLRRRRRGADCSVGHPLTRR